MDVGRWIKIGDDVVGFVVGRFCVIDDGVGQWVLWMWWFPMVSAMVVGLVRRWSGFDVRQWFRFDGGVLAQHSWFENQA